MGADETSKYYPSSQPGWVGTVLLQVQVPWYHVFAFSRSVGDFGRRF